jgi:heptosyltransferase-2
VSGDSSLVLQTSFLGDTVLTTPLIEELARRGPVDVLVTPAAASLLRGNPHIRELFVYDKRGADAGVNGVWRIARTLRARCRAAGSARGRHAAYLAQGSMRSATIALLAGFDQRVGFATAAGRALYSRRVPHRGDRNHAERLWRLAFNGEPAGTMPRPRLYPGAGEAATVDALLASTTHAPAAGDHPPLVVLAPGSVWETKRWPYYPELARRLAPSFRLAIVGGTDDAPLARAITDAVGLPTVVDAAGKLPLLASAELIGRAALLVTNDSLPQRIASAMGTPTITLFGPTVPAFGFGPLAPNSVSLGHPSLPSRPCHHHGPRRCPLGHWRCMRDLTVERVMEEVAVRLEQQRLRARDQDAGVRDQG